MSAPTDLLRLANLRDAASADPSSLRAGVLYRSEAPQPGDVAPTDLAWPPRTVVDLRSTGERAPGGHPLASPGTSLVDLPLAADLAPEAIARSRDATTPMARIYLDALAIAASWLPPLVRVAGHAEPPVLVHCAAGKDRTGLAVALLLSLARADRHAVERDYTATAAALPAVHARLDHAGERDGRPVARHSPVVPAAIAAVLDRVGDEPASFAHAHGVSPDDLAAWRARIELPVRR